MKHLFNTTIFLLCITFLLSGCATKKIQQANKPDPEIERNMTSGFSAYSKGNIEKAIFYYYKALEKARLANDSYAIGNAAYNCAAASLQKGDITSAMSYLKEAEAEYSISGNVPQEFYLLYATALELSSRYEEALQKLIAITNASTKLLAQKKLLKTRLLYKTGQINESEEELKKLLNDKKNFSELSIRMQAEVMELAAELSNSRSDQPKTIKYLKEALALYQKAYAYNRMAETAKNLAKILENNDKPNAAEYYLQSARTFYYLNETNSVYQILQSLDSIVSNKNITLSEHTIERINLLKAIAQNPPSNTFSNK